MAPDEVRALIADAVPTELRERPGAVLYCGTDALRPGRVYMMGLNPGGHPSENHKPLIETIPERTRFSEYTHECWRCPQGVASCEHLGADGRVMASALLKHQRNVIRIAEAVGIAPESLFSANAIFGRSTSLATLHEQSGYDLDTWWAACWRAHQRFFAIVRPRVIVSLGYGLHSSALGLLKRKAPVAELRGVGDNGWVGGREFEATFDLGGGDSLHARVIGVPHPSWFTIGPLLTEELRRATG